MFSNLAPPRTFPVVANGNLLSHAVVAEAKHRFLHAVREDPLQVVGVCRLEDGALFMGWMAYIKMP